jgi:hypothetical protein
MEQFNHDMGIFFFPLPSCFFISYFFAGMVYLAGMFAVFDAICCNMVSHLGRHTPVVGLLQTVECVLVYTEVERVLIAKGMLVTFKGVDGFGRLCLTNLISDLVAS